jgi:hypothetical protein
VVGSSGRNTRTLSRSACAGEDAAGQEEPGDHGPDAGDLDPFLTGIAHHQGAEREAEGHRKADSMDTRLQPFGRDPNSTWKSSPPAEAMEENKVVPERILEAIRPTRESNSAKFAEVR